MGDKALVVADCLAGEDMYIGFPLVLDVLRAIDAVLLALLGAERSLGVTVLEDRGRNGSQI